MLSQSWANHTERDCLGREKWQGHVTMIASRMSLEQPLKYEAYKMSVMALTDLTTWISHILLVLASWPFGSVINQLSHQGGRCRMTKRPTKPA
jgi:hypothetical protein